MHVPLVFIQVVACLCFSCQTLAWTTTTTILHKRQHLILTTPQRWRVSSTPTHTVSRTQLYATPMGPMARAKKAMDPTDYERVVVTKMKQDNISRAQAEADYNAFLENPPFYYALEKKEEYYQSLGYKDAFEGMIGEAEKVGPEEGKAMRKRIEGFRLRSKIKAYSVLVVTVVGFYLFREIYIGDPTILKGGLPDYHY